MNAHPFEETLSGKLLLLTAKIIMPLLVLSLLVVTPTFVPRRLLQNSYLLDLVLRLMAALVLLRAFWRLPDLVQRYNPQAPGWSTRLWLRAARRTGGAEFFLVYLVYTGAVTLLVSAVSAWAFSAFLPATGVARWLLPVLFGLMFVVGYALQYAPMRQKVTGLAPISAPTTPPGGGYGHVTGRGSAANRRAMTRPTRQDAAPRPPGSVRGVVVPRRRPPDEN